jgi:hypothetical protein
MSGGAYGIDETPEQRRRNVIIGAVAVALVVVAALAVVGFVWWRHDDGGSGADAVVDRLAAALNAHSDGDLRDVACSGLADAFVSSVSGMHIEHAAKARSTQVTGDRATGLLTLTVTQPQATPPTFEQSGYVELERHGDWCVTTIYNAVAS